MLLIWSGFWSLGSIPGLETPAAYERQGSKKLLHVATGVHAIQMYMAAGVTLSIGLD